MVGVKGTKYLKINTVASLKRVDRNGSLRLELSHSGFNQVTQWEDKEEIMSDQLNKLLDAKFLFVLLPASTVRTAI